MVSKKDDKGMTAEKDEFSEWFTELMIKADLADYTKVSGSIVFKPTSWAIWEKIEEEVNKRIKKFGVKNVKFPLFIPESLLLKEKEHVEGFSPEVAWVTHTGDTKLQERLAVRPTSEAIMYDSFSKWIRSWRDLPLKYNQWANVVRWEFKHPTPFLRTREFVFNEGHTVFASEKEAVKEGSKIVKMYKDVVENYLAVPCLIGKKTDKEKFAGAVYTISMEHYMPNGKAIQGPDFHHDGQNFAKAYDIKFLDVDGKEKYAWQNTWAISTRMLGVMFAIHSDEKGLVLPPKVAPCNVVIVPILIKGKEKEVLEKAEELAGKLKKFGAFVDDRENYKPGFKFNEWELKGIPLRIEIGPKDLEEKQVVVVRRDTNEKKEVKINDVEEFVKKDLEKIQDNLFGKAKKLLYDNLGEAYSFDELKTLVGKKKLVLVPMCDCSECEDKLKADLSGVKTLNIPFSQPSKLKDSKCLICGKKADYFVYVGKSY